MKGSKELALILIALACSYGGSLLWFVIPPAGAITHSAGLADRILWGFIAL